MVALHSGGAWIETRSWKKWNARGHSRNFQTVNNLLMPVVMYGMTLILIGELA